MGEVNRYKVKVNGTETVLKLSKEDAKRYKDAELLDVAGDAAEDTSNAEATTESEPEAPESDTAAEPDTKAKAPANKSRSAQNKGA